MTDVDQLAEFERNARMASESCLLQKLRHAARALTSAYEAALLPVDLTASQFSVLTGIAGHDGVTMSDLARALGMDRTTLTRVLSPLERRGLATSSGTDKDARMRTLSLTDKGRALVSQALPLWTKAQSAATARLGAAAVAGFRAHLTRLG